jgi:sodium-coupled monocarboxylate transporter 8/12
VTVVVVGIIAIALVFVMEQLGTIYEMMFTIGSILDAPILTLFVLGMLIPWTGKKGALVGGYATLIFMIWMVVGSQWHVMNKRIQFPHLPTNIDKCNFTANETIIRTTPGPPLSPSEEPFFLFRISMMYFTMTGTVVGIIIALVISYIYNEMDASTVNPDHISPILHRLVFSLAHDKEIMESQSIFHYYKILDISFR